MNQTMQPIHLRYRDFFVGMFLLVAGAILAALFLFSLGQNRIFEKWYRLHVRFDAATGLSRGNSVTILGTQVGHVEEVNLDADGLIAVDFRIKQRFAPLVRTDSRAIIRQKGFVGDWELELLKGNPSSPGIKSGDTLPADFSPDLNQTIRTVETMVRTVTMILDSVAQGQGTIGKLINQDSLHSAVLALTGEINASLRLASKSLRSVDTAVSVFTEVGRGASVLTDTALTTLTKAGSLLAGIDSLAAASSILPGSIEELLAVLKRDLAETEVILKAVQNHWLLRKSVRKVQTDSAP